MDKRKILRLINTALEYQFETYSWFNMIDDIEDLSDEEKEWANQNISYKAYIKEVN